MKFIWSYILLIVFLCIHFSYSAVPVVLEHESKFIFKGKYLDIYEDTSQSLTIHDITDPAHSTKFVPGHQEDVFRINNTNSTYWFRLEVIDKLPGNEGLVIELHDFKISEFDIFIPDDHHYTSHTGGYRFPFANKVFLHKNFVYYLDIPKNNPTTVYIRIQTTEPVGIIGSVKTFAEFNAYSNNEYLLLSLFYGIAIAMILYNLFLAFALKDSTYIFYVVYVACIVFYTLTQDGLGFQYLWPDEAWFNHYSFKIANYLVIVTALVYARSFLNTRKYLSGLDKILFLFIIARTLIFLLSVKYQTDEFVKPFDLIGFTYIYILGIIQLKNGYVVARFYLLAFTFLLIGYYISFLVKYNIVVDTPLTVYGFNIAVLLEMITLSLALADRIKLLTLEKEKAQKEIIDLKDHLNKELEVKVDERTKELDTLIYRSSHDIRGPLKSIIGVTTVGILDLKDNAAKQYLDHVLESAQKLDAVVEHLVKITDIKQTPVMIQEINIGTVLSGVEFFIKKIPDNHKVKFDVSINNSHVLYSDQDLLQKIVRILYENVIQFHDGKKENSLACLKITVDEQHAVLEMTDNGVGVETKYHDRIFDMLYNLNPESRDTGMALYLLRMYVDKLNGSISFQSNVGLGTSISIRLKNFREKNQLKDAALHQKETTT